MELSEFFFKNPKAAIAFSGGADSAYLLYAAKKYGADVKPYYIKTAFGASFEYEDAKALCEFLGVSLSVIEYDILSIKDITKNPKNRCYYCKKAMFSALKERAKKDGYTLIIDGTNYDDDPLDRPGMKAIEELSVKSPLRECKMGKDMIRKLSYEAGLFTWNKPAYACLATRVPSGIKIDNGILRRVEAAESELHKMGFLDFRVRVYKEAALIQLKEEQIIDAAKKHDEIVKRINPYFKLVFLDLEAR